MYYNSPPRQENQMNLLISPFEPDQLQYSNNNGFDMNNNDYDYSNEYSHHPTQPLDVPIQQINNMNLYNATGMSPVAMTNNMSMSTLYNRSPSPQATESMMNNRNGSSFATDFISRSPESSSSAETNLVSPPQQYQSWSNNVLGLPPTPLEGATSQYNHHPATKRSSSVPPHFHKLKPNQDSMYNQFQVTPTLHHQQHQQHHMMPTMNKALPIQIQRVNASNNSSNRPVTAEAHRRKLDEKLEKVNFDDITVAELKEMLRERGLSASGRKAELMNRLKEESDLLAMRGGSVALDYSLQQQAPLHRRVANLNLMDAASPNNNRQQRLYAPYSPPPSRLHVPSSHHRLASSVPDSHTPTYLNDQFMMKKKPSCLRKSVGEDEELSREWTFSLSTSPASTDYYPSATLPPSNGIVSSTDVWDDQTLQNFLNQI